MADVLEPLREDVKKLLGETTGSKPHDKAIFGIVNAFNIRHNNDQQQAEYTKDTWYEWMFHYYLATINAYYKLERDNL